MIWYFIASLSPAALLAAACLLGGTWSFLSLAYVTVFVFAIDRWTRIDIGLHEETAALRAGIALNTALGLAHLVLMPLGVAALASGALTLPAAVALFLALALFFGQVSNSNAHELIHARSRWLRRLGALVYTTMLFGHHASAHVYVHHIHVATRADPNSARPGESFYTFWPRAWAGSFRAGLAEENRRRRAGASILTHPYLWYCAGAAAWLSTAWVLGGIKGLVIYVLLAGYAQTQLILVDYVQHYGLSRETADGGIARQGPQHSWNAPHWYSAVMMLNAPRHSDHHLNAGRAFPALRLDPETMPILPHSLPVMGAIALVPPVWRRVMARRLRRLEQEWRARPASAKLES